MLLGGLRPRGSSGAAKLGQRPCRIQQTMVRVQNFQILPLNQPSTVPAKRCPAVYLRPMPSVPSFDLILFHAINHGWTNPVFDAVMPIITDVRWWRPVYALGLLALAFFGGRRGRLCTIGLLMVPLILDPLSSTFLKETIDRLRPFEVLPDVIARAGASGGSFPSNHALNNTAAATILSYMYPNRMLIWWTTAVIIGVSRIYVGVHWPTDVLGGAALGLLGGLAIMMLLHIVARQLPDAWKQSLPQI
jgi:undecaprenyl-diphosphatase